MIATNIEGLCVGNETLSQIGQQILIVTDSSDNNIEVVNIFK